MSAWLLVALLLVLGAAGEASACACCADAGHWSQVTRRVTSEELSHIARLDLGPHAVLHVTAAGLDEVRGITSPAAHYTVRHRRAHRQWTVEMADERGAAGRLMFVLPDRAEIYAADPQDGATSEAAGPVLYKEWRFAGPVMAGGRFRGTRFQLILQARGHVCPEASQFTGWILRVSGAGASYALFGTWPPAAPPLYFTSPEQAVAVTTELLRRDDWPTLARYYDLSGSRIARAELTSGRFFVRTTPPATAHPGLPWRYQHPFTPGFTFKEASAAKEVGVVLVVVGIEIDEGGGRVRRGFSEFKLRQSGAGYQILPPQEGS